MPKNFELTVEKLFFSHEGSEVLIKGKLLIGSETVVWDEFSGFFCAHKLAHFLNTILSNYSLHKNCYPSLDLSNSDRNLVLNLGAGRTTTIDFRLNKNGVDVEEVEVWCGSLFLVQEHLIEEILKECILTQSRSILDVWLDRLRPRRNKDSLFKVSDYVTTRATDNVKIKRDRFVFSVFWHNKRGKYVYNLMIGSEIYKKWYFDEDLQANDRPLA